MIYNIEEIHIITVAIKCFCFFFIRENSFFSWLKTFVVLLILYRKCKNLTRNHQSSRKCYFFRISFCICNIFLKCIILWWKLLFFFQIIDLSLFLTKLFFWDEMCKSCFCLLKKKTFFFWESIFRGEKLIKYQINQNNSLIFYFHLVIWIDCFHNFNSI